MMFRSTAAAIVVLAASTAWGQSAAPASNALSSHPRRVVAESNAVGVAENARTQSTMRQRVDEMGNTLTRMHAVLKQMQAKTSTGSSADPLAKANLEMWGLMLADLDKQYAQLRLASHAREDLESRRAAMYKQAESKAALAGKNAPASGAAPSASASDQGAPATAAGTNAAAPATPPAQSTPATSSPN